MNPEVSVTQTVDETIVKITHTGGVLEDPYLSALLLDLGLRILKKELGLVIDDTHTPVV